MYIKNVTIKNLWGKYDINWELELKIYYAIILTFLIAH